MFLKIVVFVMTLSRLVMMSQWWWWAMWCDIITSLHPPFCPHSRPRGEPHSAPWYQQAGVALHNTFTIPITRDRQRQSPSSASIHDTMWPSLETWSECCHCARGPGLVTGQGLVSEIIPGFLEIYFPDRGHTRGAVFRELNIRIYSLPRMRIT